MAVVRAWGNPMKRSIIAVMAGWTLAVLLINGWKWILMHLGAAGGSSFRVFLFCIAGSAAAGGYLAAALSGRAAAKHGMIVGVLVACIFFRDLMVHHPGPVWHDFWPFWMAMAGGIVGGVLRALASGDRT
jgi:hypothetical protein